MSFSCLEMRELLMYISLKHFFFFTSVTSVFVFFPIFFALYKILCVFDCQVLLLIMTRFICLTCCSCFQNSFRIPLTFDLFRLRNGNINDNRYVTFIDSFKKFSSNGTTCWLSMILQYFLLLLLLLYGHTSSFYKHIVCTCAFWVLLYFCTHWHKLFDTCTYGIYSNAQSSVFSASNKIRIKEIYTQTITRTQTITQFQSL